MVAHVVLFRPKHDLSEAERRAFVAALEHALQNIPFIRRARLGRRLAIGRQYDAENPHQFPYAAILEFDSETGLRAYLDHAAHRALGEQFYLASEATLVFDYDMDEPDRAGDLLLPQ